MIERLLAYISFLSVSCMAFADVTAAADTVMLTEMEVTAIKQHADLDRLPLAATLITAAETERLNIVSIRGISDVVPNFFVPEYGSRMTSSIYVRGLGARMDQPAVGLNVDNVTFLNKDAYDFDIADIVRVEMLRGPQSTLYGRNTMGGQINITTLSPLQWQGWRIAATVGNGFSAKGNIGWYGLLRDKMGLAVTAAYTYGTGWFRNEYNGKKTDRQNLWSARLKYDWRISPSVSLLNTFSASGLHQSGYPYEYVTTGHIEYNDTCFYRRFALNDGLTVRWRAPGFTLSSITSWQYLDDNMTLDQDFLPLSYFTLTQKKRENALTQDIIFRGNAGKVYSWTSGAFGFYKHLDMKAPVTFLDEGIARLIEDHRNDANPYYPIRWDSRSFPLHSDFILPTYGLALYHQSDVTLGRWHLSAGLRLDYEHVSMDFNSRCNTGYEILMNNFDGTFTPYRHVDVNIDDYGHLSKHFLQLLPKFAVMFDLGDDSASNVYVNVSKGYKAGGFNTQMFSDILQQRLMGIMGIGGQYDVDQVVGYKPEKSWNYEVGAHLEALDGRFTAELSAFYIDCRDQQLTMFPDGTTTGRIMTNAGRTRSFGAEAQLALTDWHGFTFRASYGFTNARFRRFFDGRQDYRGKVVPYAPRNTVFLQTVYLLKTPRSSFLDDIAFDVNMRATGKIYWNEANSLHQPFYALLGASATFTRGDCSLQLWGENLTDTKYKTFYFVSIGNEFVQRGVPLRWGVTLRLNF